jgi:hypothetical protein
MSRRRSFGCATSTRVTRDGSIGISDPITARLTEPSQLSMNCSLSVIKTHEAIQSYFGNRLQGSALKPLNWKSEPTAIGWSETTLTVVDTFGPPGGLS